MISSDTYRGSSDDVDWCWRIVIHVVSSSVTHLQVRLRSIRYGCRQISSISNQKQERKTTNSARKFHHVIVNRPQSLVGMFVRPQHQINSVLIEEVFELESNLKMRKNCRSCCGWAVLRTASYRSWVIFRHVNTDSVRRYRPRI